MLKFISLQKYVEMTGHLIVPATVRFVPEMTNIVPEDVLETILHDIEGTELVQRSAVSKFSEDSKGYLIRWEDTSAGTQTAISIAYYTYKKEQAYIWLGQCGREALIVCTRLLDQSEYVTGVLDQMPTYCIPSGGLPVIYNGKCYDYWDQVRVEEWKYGSDS